MFLNVFLMLIFVKLSFSTTSIKTYPTVNLRENVPINTNVIQLIKDEEKFEMKQLKLILLNLGGYETNLFEIKNDIIYTINEIDREQFIGEKRCFDRLYCLIELHILVNDGQQYWVVPIHIVEYVISNNLLQIDTTFYVFQEFVLFKLFEIQPK